MAGYELEGIPDWSGSFKPSEQPESDKSRGIAYQNIAKGIEGGAEVAERGMEDYLKNKVRAGVEATREPTIASYENIRQAQLTGQQADPNAVRTAGFGPDAGGSGGAIPPGLQTGLDRATQLGLAKAQGKGNDTLYTGALYSMAKQLRSQFPGHADFIDEQISKITGINPANAYMQNLLVDINRSGQKEDNYQKAIFSKANEYMGNKEVFTAYKAVEAGVPGAWETLQQSVFKAASQDAQHKQWEQQHNENQWNTQDTATNATTQWTKRSNQIVDEHFNPIFQHTGISTPQRMYQLMQAHMNGQETLTSAQWSDMLSVASAAKMDIQRSLNDTANKEGYKTRINDPAKIKSINDDAMSTVDGMIDAIKNKDIGTLFEWQRRNTAEIDDTRHQMYSSNIGALAKTRAVANQDLGSNWMNLLDMKTILNKNVMGDITNFYSDATRAASMDPSKRFGRNFDSLYDSLVAAKEARSSGANFKDVAYDNFVQNVDLITKAKEQGRTDIAKNVVDYMFNPDKNARVMDFFGKEMGQEKGRNYVYQTLTNPAITDAIRGLNDPQSWQMYKDWQTKSFKTIFNDQVQNISEALRNQDMTFAVHWDGTNSRLEIVPEQNFKPRNPNSVLPQDIQSANIDILKREVNKLNSGLGNLSYMARQDGSDANAMVWDTLQQMGVQPSTRTTGDLPSRIMMAIRSSTNTNKELTEEVLRQAGEKRKKQQQ